MSSETIGPDSLILRGFVSDQAATLLDDLLAVSDADEIMPPKSTWFEPKLRDGLLIHTV